MKKTDLEIQTDVSRALSWDPSIKHELIGIRVHEGVVTLMGIVTSYFEKIEAEQVTQRVSGVKAVIQKIQVKVGTDYARDDQDIAEAIIERFKWSISVPSSSILVRVEDGWVELRGEVMWGFERAAAENCIKDIVGIQGIANEIIVKSTHASVDKIKKNIEDALNLETKMETNKIMVDVHGGRVTLSGDAHSFAEVADAGWAAWCSPGVTEVVNNLHVNNY